MIAWLLVRAGKGLGGLRGRVRPTFPIGSIPSGFPVFVAPPVTTALARGRRVRRGLLDGNDLKQSGCLAGAEFKVQRSADAGCIFVVHGQGFLLSAGKQGRNRNLSENVLGFILSDRSTGDLSARQLVSCGAVIKPKFSSFIDVEG